MSREKMFWATGIVGLLLVIAPWALGYSTFETALVSSLVLGVLMVIVSIIEGVRRDSSRWEYLVIGLLAILAIIAPFVEGFRTALTALLASLVLGIVELALALLAAFVAKPEAQEHKS